ncbi:MAG: hypothetical protein K1X55_07700 [Chitinophagales bacterium]|nr:hypothetical protein [Chitinophagales bacterium]
MNKIYKFSLFSFLILLYSNSLISQELEKQITDEGLINLEKIVFQDLSGSNVDLNLQSYLLSDEERFSMVEKLNKFVDSASLNVFGKIEDVLKSQAINYVKGNKIMFKNVEFLGLEKSDYYGYDLFGFHYKVKFKDEEIPESKINVIFSRMSGNYKLLFIYCNNLNF